MTEKKTQAQTADKKTFAYVKKRIFDIIQIGNKEDFPSRFFDIFITVTILLNIGITFLLTFDGMEKYAEVLSKVEFVTIIIFLVEYGLRIWTAKYLYPESKSVMAAVRYVVSFYGIIDLLTILPYFLPFVFLNGAVAFRMFRVVRIFHLFRINSQYDAFNVITEVLKEKRNQLLSSVVLILILIMAASLCMYDLEHAAQPENFSNAFSGIWWSVSTLLTVGYGDIYPVTVGGRLMAICIAFLGVGVVAIPTGIISAGFMEYYSRLKVAASDVAEELLIDVKMIPGHPYIGKKIRDIKLEEGRYVAVICRGEDVNVGPDPAMKIRENDILIIHKQY